MEIGLHGGKDGGKEFLVDEFRQGFGTLLAKPENEIGTCRAFPDESACMVGERLALVLVDEEFHHFAAQPRLRCSGEPKGAVLPVLGKGRGEGLENLCVFCGGNLGENLG